MYKKFGGRLTVGRQALDLEVGVRIPASEPFVQLKRAVPGGHGSGASKVL